MKKFDCEGELQCSFCCGTNEFKVQIVPLGFSVDANGKQVLLTNMLVFPANPGSSTMCKAQPNPHPIETLPYLPCTLMSTVVWNSLSNETVDGLKTLTKDSYAVCPVCYGKLTLSNFSKELK